MSEQAIALKAQEVEVVAEKFKNSASAVVVDVRGLTVAESTELRDQLRAEGIELKVIKNKILSRAADKAELSDLNDLFVGPSAVAFSTEDAVAPARILKKFSDNVDALEIKGGVVEGNVSSLDEINRFAALPGKDGLLGQLLAEFQFPVRSFAYAVKALMEKREAEGEVAEAPAAEAQDAPVEETTEAPAEEVSDAE